MRSTILTLGLAVLSCLNASAGVITFDDAYADNVWNPSTYYSPLGLTIEGSYTGVLGGVGNGDPGNWDLEGTNGSALLGCNEGNGCSPTFRFDSAVNNFSVDLGIAFGSSAMFTVQSYLAGELQDSKVIEFSDEANLGTGTWRTVAFDRQLDSVVVNYNSNDYFAFGVDNVQFNTESSAVPEPSSMMLCGGALASAGFLFRRRNR